MTKLRQQILDPRNPGLGDRAREHLARIQELLDTTPTEFRPPPAEAGIAEHTQFADMLEAHIRELMAEWSNLGIVDGRAGTHAEFHARRAKHKARIVAGDFQRKHTDEMQRDLRWTENEVNRWLQPDPPLVLGNINHDADEVGKFKYTWRNFVERVSPVAIALAVILGALLDIIGPVMALGLYRPQYD